MSPEPTTVDALFDRYRGFLIDAYGVLVDGTGGLPGAAAFIERLERESRPWRVVTNDASRSPAACGARYRTLGVPVPDERVLTSGLLLAPFFADRSSVTALVLGPPDTHAYVRETGARALPPDAEDLLDASVIVLGDAGGFDFLEGLDRALSLCTARLEKGQPIDLVVPNPDLIYPKAPATASRPATFGFAAGTMLEMLERALALRHPNSPLLTVHRLGKPAPALFRAGLEALGTTDVVMLGDQLATDIVGARAAGVDAALVVSGVSAHIPDSGPRWVLSSLFSP